MIKSIRREKKVVQWIVHLCRQVTLSRVSLGFRVRYTDVHFCSYPATFTCHVTISILPACDPRPARYSTYPGTYQWNTKC